MIKKVLFIALAFTVFYSCKDDNNDPITEEPQNQLSQCDSIAAVYTNDIQTIMETNCAVAYCHNSESKANGLDLSSYEMVKGASAYPAFLGAMKGNTQYTAMPFNKAPISASDIDRIECWISSGTPE